MTLLPGILMVMSAATGAPHGNLVSGGGRTLPPVSRAASRTTSDDPTDRDGDGVPDNVDNCPGVFNPDQQSAGPGANGDACQPGPGGPSVQPPSAPPAGGSSSSTSSQRQAPAYGCSVDPNFAMQDDSAPQLIALGAIAILVVWAGSAWRATDRSARRSP